MAIWIPADVTDEPIIDLNQWAIYEFVDGARIAVGTRNDGTGRVSSPIVTFDKEFMQVVTESGRVYRLHNRGMSSNGSYTFNMYYGHVPHKDVSDEY